MRRAAQQNTARRCDGYVKQDKQEKQLIKLGQRIARSWQHGCDTANQTTASAGPVPTFSEGAFGLALSLTQPKQNPTIMKLDCAEDSLPFIA